MAAFENKIFRNPLYKIKNKLRIFQAVNHDEKISKESIHATVNQIKKEEKLILRITREKRIEIEMISVGIIITPTKLMMIMK